MRVVSQRTSLSSRLVKARALITKLTHTLSKAREHEAQLEASVKALTRELEVAQAALKNALADGSKAKAFVQRLLTDRAKLRAEVSQLSQAARCSSLKAALMRESKRVARCSGTLSSVRATLGKCKRSHAHKTRKVRGLLNSLELVVRKSAITRKRYFRARARIQAALTSSNRRLISLTKRCSRRGTSKKIEYIDMPKTGEYSESHSDDAEQVQMPSTPADDEE